MPLPSLNRGEGGRGKRNIAYLEVMELKVPRPRQRTCLQQGLKLDINLLARRGLIAPGSATGPHAIRWVNSNGEVITSGWISADMRSDSDGLLHIQIGDLDQTITSLPCPATLAAASGSSSAR